MKNNPAVKAFNGTSSFQMASLDPNEISGRRPATNGTYGPAGQEDAKGGSGSSSSGRSVENGTNYDSNRIG